MRAQLSLTTIIALALLAGCSRDKHVEYAEPPTGVGVDIDTPAGPLRGIEAGGLRYFLGIPYAEPPVGSLRFAPPRARAVSATPIDATRYGSACPQIPGHHPGDPLDDTTVVEGNEDCLTLNVIGHPSGEPRPVMVFVHGGGFQQGNGSKPDYEGTLLARDGDVVVVTFNYRLGPLGFLADEALAAEGADGSAGNQGIRDQIAALAWVRDNISSLGGDASRVTIFGESAGATSVCALAASPITPGLFHRAIVQSASCADVLPLRATSGESAMARGATVAEAAGCGGDGALACLRALDAATIVRAGARAADARAGSLGLFHAPCIDDSVLVASPIERLASGEGDVPMIVGSNADESNAFLLRTSVADDAEYRAWLDRLFGARAEAVLSIYPSTSLGSPTDTLRRALTEVSFTCPGLALAEAASAGTEPSYTYYFAYHREGRVASMLGAFHGIELGYLFRDSPAGSPDETDRAMGRALRTSWSTFARTGVPDAVPTWPAYSAGTATVMRLEPAASLVADPSEGRCAQLVAAGVVRSP